LDTWVCVSVEHVSDMLVGSRKNSSNSSSSSNGNNSTGDKNAYVLLV